MLDFKFVIITVYSTTQALLFDSFKAIKSKWVMRSFMAVVKHI